MEVVTNSYSIDQMLRYAFEYEVSNYLKIRELEVSEDTKEKIIRYLEDRITEIKNRKYSK
jgi:hypothetical protein